MIVKKDTKIKVLEDVSAIPIEYIKASEKIKRKYEVLIPKYEIITVLGDLGKDKYHICNIIDEEYIIPKNILFKIIGKSNSSNNSNNKKFITAAPFKSINVGTKKISIDTDEIPSGNKTRAIQKLQIITSNVMSTEDILASNKYILAALCANMSITKGITSMQSNKLLAYCTKLIGSTNG